MPNPREIIEARIGIQGIEELHNQRRHLVAMSALLRARHGPFGTWEAIRKSSLCTIRSHVRAQHLAAGTKATEAALDDVAHVAQDYKALVTTATEERAQLAVIDNQITDINDLIYRDNTLIFHLTAESKLQ